VFFEQHIKAAKENPAFKTFVTLLENEIKDRTAPILTKEDQLECFLKDFYESLTFFF